MNTQSVDLTAGFYSLFNSLVNKNAVIEIHTKNGATISGTVESVDFNLNFVLKNSSIEMKDGRSVR